MKNNGYCAVIAALFGALIIATASAQEFEVVDVSNACSYYGEEGEEIGTVLLFESDSEALEVIESILDINSLESNFVVRAASVETASAMIVKGRRHILYNQEFIRKMRQRTGSKWAAISIMAHEIAHHLNGHTLTSDGSRPSLELHADIFSGNTLQRMGATLEEARLAMELSTNIHGNSRHPAKRDRLAAITNGWVRACNANPVCKNGNDYDGTGGPARDPVTGPTATPAVEMRQPDSCDFSRDGECDEPDVCDVGTDTYDCRQSTADAGPIYDRGRNPAANSAPIPQRGPGPAPYPLYCCDAFGRKWCPIVVNPGPPGTACVCAGVVGSGTMCY